VPKTRSVPALGHAGQKVVPSGCPKGYILSGRPCNCVWRPHAIPCVSGSDRGRWTCIFGPAAGPPGSLLSPPTPSLSFFFFSCLFSTAEPPMQCHRHCRRPPPPSSMPKAVLAPSRHDRDLVARGQMATMGRSSPARWRS
jgi:hypothetical protein